MTSRAVLILVAVLALAGVVMVAAAPLYAFQALSQAARRGDQAGVAALVDFPALRANLKTQLTARVETAIQNDRGLGKGPFRGLGALLAPTLVDQVVDATVTPEGVSAIAAGGRAPLSDFTGLKSALPPPPEATPARPAGIPRPGAKKPRTSFAYRGPNTFVGVTANGDNAPLAWVMERRGLGWKLTNIELPPA